MGRRLRGREAALIPWVKGLTAELIGPRVGRVEAPVRDVLHAQCDAGRPIAAETGAGAHEAGSRRVVRDQEGADDWKVETAPFPGWATVPEW